MRFRSEDTEFYENLLKELQMETCRDATALSSPSTSYMPQTVEYVAEKQKHGLFRRAVGQLQ